MAKYIDRDKQLVRLHQLNLSCEDVIKEFLMSAEAVDAVEVIRCKDCKHHPIDTGTNNYGQELEFPDEVCPCLVDDHWYSWMPKDNWFCAAGERREDGD